MKQSFHKSYLLAVLLIILAFNYVDRFALGLLLQSIKIDLHLSDTQLGLLSGIAFALFYAVMGIPIARWADRGDRVRIISITTALWSVAVALCATVNSFAQLLLIRIGVAVGEAGCIPPAHSLIADHFTRAERPRALARYMLGAPLSLVIGYFFAGWLNQFYGWRLTFVFLGLPGLLLTALARLTLRDPRRKRSPAQPVEPPSGAEPGLKTVVVTLYSNVTFLHLLMCFSVSLFFGFGILQWQPAFFIRSYGMSTGELGTWFAMIYGLGGILGTYLGGEMAARHAAHDERLQLKWMAAIYGGFSVISAFVYLSPNRHVAFAIMALAAIMGGTTTGPLFAIIQTLVPERMRAMSIALVYLFANFIGMGLGPLAAGALSDAFRRWAGEESLRYALLALCPGYLWAGWHLWRASRSIGKDLESLTGAQAESAVRGAGVSRSAPDMPTTATR